MMEEGGWILATLRGHDGGRGWIIATFRGHDGGRGLDIGNI